MLNKNRFIELMAGLSELFDKEMTDSLFRIYAESLKAYTDEEIEIAINRAGATCRFFPKPAELIEMIDGSPEGRAAEAYTKLKESCARVGAYNSVQFDDPAITSVVRSWGGWVNLCKATYDEWRYNYTLKQFKTLYEMACMYPEDNRYLSGITEAANSQKGLAEHIPDPVQVGTKGRLQIAGKSRPAELPEAKDIGPGNEEEVKIDLPEITKGLLH